MKSLQLALTALFLATTTVACATSEDSIDSESTESSDLGSAKRHLQCVLEYARYSPDYHTSFAATFDELMSKVKANGATASDGKFAFQVQVNPNPPYNLPFIVSLRDLTTDQNLAYSVLPAPRLGGDFLFEMGARIAPVTLPVPSLTTDQQFDYLRSYCSLTLVE
jgi:hypothetical protein